MKIAVEQTGKKIEEIGNLKRQHESEHFTESGRSLQVKRKISFMRAAASWIFALTVSALFSVVTMAQDIEFEPPPSDPTSGEITFFPDGDSTALDRDSDEKGLSSRTPATPPGQAAQPSEVDEELQELIERCNLEAVDAAGVCTQAETTSNQRASDLDQLNQKFRTQPGLQVGPVCGQLSERARILSDSVANMGNTCSQKQKACAATCEGLMIELEDLQLEKTKAFKLARQGQQKCQAAAENQKALSGLLGQFKNAAQGWANCAADPTFQPGKQPSAPGGIAGQGQNPYAPNPGLNGGYAQQDPCISNPRGCNEYAGAVSPTYNSLAIPQNDRSASRSRDVGLPHIAMPSGSQRGQDGGTEQNEGRNNSQRGTEPPPRSGGKVSFSVGQNRPAKKNQDTPYYGPPPQAPQVHTGFYGQQVGSFGGARGAPAINSRIPAMPGTGTYNRNALRKGDSLLPPTDPKLRQIWMARLQAQIRHQLTTPGLSQVIGPDGLVGQHVQLFRQIRERYRILEPTLRPSGTATRANPRIRLSNSRGH